MIKFEFVNRIKENCELVEGEYKNELGVIRLPERATKRAAGYDFIYNDVENTIVLPGQIKYVKTGVKAIFPEDMTLKLYNRSSNPKKKGLIVVNGVGVVDGDYYNNPDNEGEIAFAFMNILNVPVTIQFGDKLGQGIFEKFYVVDDEQTIETERVSGFGSTGK